MAVIVSGVTVDGVPACEPVASRIRDGRWVEIELYKLNSGNWLAHRTGKSRVYHKHPTLCVTRTGKLAGEQTTGSDLPEDAVPCRSCRPVPLAVLPPGQPVRMEVDWHSWDEAPTPQLLQTRLTTARSRDGSVSVFMSDLTLHLFENAAREHPEFAELLAA